MTARPPATSAGAPTTPTDGGPPRRSRQAVVAMIFACLPFMSWGACASQLVDRTPEGISVWMFTCLLSFGGFWLALGAVRRLRADDDQRPLGRSVALVAAVVACAAPFVSAALGLATERWMRG
jgi:uncharacterized membrane protein YfcA